MQDAHDRLLAAIPHMRAFARALTGDAERADTLVAECLEGVSRAGGVAPAWRETDFTTWLYNRLYRLFVATHAAPFGHTAGGTGARPGRRGGDIAVTRLEEALARLPHQWRAAVILIAMHGLADSQVAGILNIPVGAVRDQYDRGRSMLKDMLYGDLLSFARGQNLGVFKGGRD